MTAARSSLPPRLGTSIHAPHFRSKQRTKETPSGREGGPAHQAGIAVMTRCTPIHARRIATRRVSRRLPAHITQPVAFGAKPIPTTVKNNC